MVDNRIHMRYRKLGRTNFEISEMGYGAWGIGGHLWIGAADRESLKALRRAIELGLNFIDTALAYGDGHSEELVGRVSGDAGTRNLHRHQSAAQEFSLARTARHRHRARFSRMTTF